ncbi:unnamed protein product [Bursaphelenchus okinawaensis]|uniref:SH2 domain-containing protein n=1 Tax=Bursaphelenchus okinawaensis TaxID=465554 RepID=A0A811JQ00_9BILA|nr:unnamed protein product [Bursaphelenchus okinawaensis]CAG9076863.1 unnamed protein product [Bursaphelenchus okinawaensis]
MDDTTTTSSSSSSGHTSRVQRPRHIPITIQTIVPARQISTTSPNVSTVRIQGFNVDSDPDYENSNVLTDSNMNSPNTYVNTDVGKDTTDEQNVNFSLQPSNRTLVSPDHQVQLKIDQNDQPKPVHSEFETHRIPCAISIQMNQKDVPVTLAVEEEVQEDILPTTSTHLTSVPPPTTDAEAKEKKHNIFRASLDKLREKSRSLSKSDSKEGRSKIPLAKTKSREDKKVNYDLLNPTIPSEGGQRSSDTNENLKLFEDDTRRDSVQTAFNVEAEDDHNKNFDDNRHLELQQAYQNPPVTKSSTKTPNFTVVSPQHNIRSVSPRNTEVKLNPLTSIAFRQNPPITVSNGEDTDVTISVHENCSETAEISTRIVMDKDHNIRSASDIEIEVKREITTDFGPSTTAHLKAPNSRENLASGENVKEKKQKPKLIRLDLNKSNPIHYQDSDEIIHESPKYVVAQPEDFDFALKRHKSASPKATNEDEEPKEDVMILRNKTTDDIIVLRRTDGGNYDTVSLASNDQLVLRGNDDEEVMVLRKEKRAEPPLEIIVEETPKRTKSASPARDFKTSIKRLVSRSMSPHKHIEVVNEDLKHEETTSPSSTLVLDNKNQTINVQDEKANKEDEQHQDKPSSTKVSPKTTENKTPEPTTPTEAIGKLQTIQTLFQEPASPTARSVHSTPPRSPSPKKSPEKIIFPGPKENYGFSRNVYEGPLDPLTVSKEFSKDDDFFKSTTVSLAKTSEVQEENFIRKNRSVLRFDSIDKGDKGMKTVDVNVYEDENELVIERKIEIEKEIPEGIEVNKHKLVLEVHKESLDFETKPKIDPAEERYDDLDKVSEMSYQPDPNVEIRLSPMKEASVEPGKTFMDMSIRVESPPPVPEEEISVDINEEKVGQNGTAEVRVYRERFSEAPILPITDSASFAPDVTKQSGDRPSGSDRVENEDAKASKAEDKNFESKNEAPPFPVNTIERPKSIEIQKHEEIPLQGGKVPIEQHADVPLQPVKVTVDDDKKGKRRPLISPVSPEEREILRNHKNNIISPRPKAIAEDILQNIDQPEQYQREVKTEKHTIVYSRSPKLDEDLKHEEQRLDSLSDEVMRQALELNMLDATTPRQNEWKESSVPRNRNSAFESSTNSADVVYSPKIVNITQIEENSNNQKIKGFSKQASFNEEVNVPLAMHDEDDDLYNEMKKDQDKFEAAKEQRKAYSNQDENNVINDKESNYSSIKRKAELRQVPLNISSPGEGKENGYPHEINGTYRPNSEASSRPRRRPQSPILAPAPRIGAQSPAPSHTSDFSFSPRTLTRINNFNIVMESIHDNDDYKDTATDNGEVITHHPVFMRDTSKYWYKPGITREEAINMLKDKEPGTFVVRDSNSFPGAFGLALKVAQPPAGVERADGTELVRHFLIEPSAKGVKLKGCNNEPVFGTLAALIYQHSITALALPEKLILPEYDPAQSAEHVNANQALLERGAACNVTYICSLDTESLTGPEAVRRATNFGIDLLARRQLCAVPVHFKVSAQGITLTDNTRTLFFRRHYPVNSVTFAGIDPDSRTFDNNNTQQLPTTYVRQAPVFGFVARKAPNSVENTCHIFAELDPEQPASAVVRFITNVMMVQARAQQAAISRAI